MRAYTEKFKQFLHATECTEWSNLLKFFWEWVFRDSSLTVDSCWRIMSNFYTPFGIRLKLSLIQGSHIVHHCQNKHGKLMEVTKVLRQNVRLQLQWIW